MARRKKESEDGGDDARLESIEKALEQLRKYQARVADLKEKRNAVVACMSDPAIRPIFQNFESDIASMGEALVTCEKKDVDKYQQGVIARRGLLAQMKAAYSSELETACADLRKYEAENELILSEAKMRAAEEEERTIEGDFKQLPG